VLQRLARGLDTSPQTGKAGFDALREAVVHGLLLALALRRAHQDEGLAAVRPLADLGLHTFAHDVPVVCIEQLLGKALELLLVGTDEIAAPGVLEPCDVVRAGHATIHDPDAMGLAVTSLHRVHDVLDRGHIHAIAIEHLVAERHALARATSGMQTCLQSGRWSRLWPHFAMGLRAAWPSKYVLVTS
jgi:hypothetical protein